MSDEKNLINPHRPKNYKLLIGSVVGGVVVGALFYFFPPNTQAPIEKAQEKDAVTQKENNVTDGGNEKTVISFESLDKVERFEDLEKYGLTAPEQYNHKSGKNLILLALKANAFFKGEWMAAHGLLGANMLNVDVEDRIGYTSLFFPMYLNQGFKMYASTIVDNDPLLANFDGTIKKPKSIIARREGAIYVISSELENRYIYDDSGNFGRHYRPEPNRQSNQKLENALTDGLEVYDLFLNRGYDDTTLRDSLCMAYASLDYDGTFIRNSDIYKLGHLQVCTDALKAVLEKLNKSPDHSYNFLYELGWEMETRDLSQGDKMLLPTDEKNHQALLKIVAEDLDAIEKK